MTPTEVTEKLQLSKLKDKIWYVVPSCATTGEGLFEGLVSNSPGFFNSNPTTGLIHDRAGYPTTSRLHHRSKVANEHEHSHWH